MPKIGLEITTSNQDLENMILDSIKHDLSNALQRSVDPIKKRLMDLCDGLIKSTPEYASLINGQLMGELGITYPVQRMEEIITTIKNSLEVAYQPLVKKSGGLSGGLMISILKSDFSDVLGLPAASYVTSEGTQIKWLDWLLMQGNRIIVVGYDVVPAIKFSQKRASRTGLAVMAKGTGWGVSFGSGVMTDNFLTRAFNIGAIESLVTDIVADEVEKSI